MTVDPIEVEKPVCQGAGQIHVPQQGIVLKTKCSYCGKIVDLHITEDDVWIDGHPSPYFGRPHGVGEIRP